MGLPGGTDWPLLAKGSYDGAPQDLAPSETALKEDWITCLAETPDGALWVGHRDKGYEKLAIPSLQRLAEGTGNVRTLIPLAGGALIVGTYGKGRWLPIRRALKMARQPPPRRQRRTRPQPGRSRWRFPSPAAPPREAELGQMCARLQALAPSKQDVEAMSDDWQTKGDWPGRDGHRYALVSGYAWNRSATAAAGYSALLCTGPWRTTASLYSYGTGSANRTRTRRSTRPIAVARMPNSMTGAGRPRSSRGRWKGPTCTSLWRFRQATIA